MLLSNSIIQRRITATHSGIIVGLAAEATVQINAATDSRINTVSIVVPP
jgi:hypothetical protein